MNNKRFYVDINLLNKQLINSKFESLAADPNTNLFDGRIYYNTVAKKLRVYDGTNWTIVTEFDAGIFTVDPLSNSYLTITVTDGKASIKLNVNMIPHDDLSGAGSYTHADIDNHINNTTNPHSVTLEQARSTNNALAGDINMNNFTITNIKDVLSTDSPSIAVNKKYVDDVTLALSAGLKIRQHVQLATTAPLTAIANGSKEGKTLSATTNELLSIDSTNVALGWRILVKDQINAIDNGIYTVTQTGSALEPWILTRTGEFDSAPETELKASDYFFVRYGIDNNNTGWTVQPVNNTDPDVDVTDIIFSQFSGIGTYTAGQNIDMTNSIISVKNYNATDGTEVTVGKIISQLLVVGENTIIHNLGGRVGVNVVDNTDNKVVIVEVVEFDSNTIKIKTSLVINATIMVFRILTL